MKRDIVDYMKGETKKIAFVFSCPGQEEQKSKKLVNGKTGENLDLLIEKNEDKVLSKIFDKEEINNWKKYKHKNPKGLRYFFRITNASNFVHYKIWNGRTEAKTSEIKNVDNIDRLIGELYDIEDAIICFGKKAKEALNHIQKFKSDKLNHNVRIVYLRHLGLQSLNQIKEVSTTEERLKVVADDFIRQMEN
ncbi:hypothetical protein [Moheibacter sediminis]|uniref:Uracil DNA glycosylase superfamily protein n=1 Tax=Moheibacter sediminis TaxID=1434700 RepID=A0A1W2B0J3_9FLAO|nr:hypothetical protein [Moheibacter sediminis]SMC66456.1 hypothetical protein SAMN06296427_105226 [Moheibacter sediminis]